MSFDGKRFYVAYLDTRLRNNPYFFPVINNVHVAAFDTAWNKVDDVAVTSFDTTDLYMAGRPWVILHNNRLYVSYDIDSLEPVTRKELLMWQARVSIYEFNPEFTSIKQNEEINNGFQLEQNYPNPCNSVTSIDFSVPSRQMTTLKVYDIQGREVAVLVNEMKLPGEYTVTFNTKELPDGVYFYQLIIGGYFQMGFGYFIHCVE